MLDASSTAFNPAFGCSAGHRVVTNIWTMVSSCCLVLGLCDKQ